jgi:hypothetical protein
LEHAGIYSFALHLAALDVRPAAAAGLQLHDSAGSVSRNIFLFMTTCDSLALSFSALESDLSAIKLK